MIIGLDDVEQQWWTKGVWAGAQREGVVGQAEPPIDNPTILHNGSTWRQGAGDVPTYDYSTSSCTDAGGEGVGQSRKVGCREAQMSQSGNPDPAPT